MPDIYRFLEFIKKYEALIYILLAIGGMFSFRWLWKSLREWQTAVFKLEREFSARRLGQSAVASILITVLFCAAFYVGSFVVPGLPADFFMQTPTLDLISTPTGTLSAEMMTQYAIASPQFVPANTVGCVPDQLMITSPKPGEEITGLVELMGTANIPNFAFYKYEVASQGSDTWATIAAGQKVITNGSLGNWNTTTLAPGEYQLRLVVTDNQGQSLSPCIVPVRVVAPPQ